MGGDGGTAWPGALCLLSSCAIFQPHAFLRMDDASTDICRRTPPLPKDFPARLFWDLERVALGPWEPEGTGRPGPGHSGLCDGRRVGVGRPHPSAKAAPAPLRHIFFSLSREQLDLKNCIYVGVGSFVSLCPEAVHVMRAQVLYFRELLSFRFVFRKM